MEKFNPDSNVRDIQFQMKEPTPSQRLWGWVSCARNNNNMHLLIGTCNHLFHSHAQQTTKSALRRWRWTEQLTNLAVLAYDEETAGLRGFSILSCCWWLSVVALKVRALEQASDVGLAQNNILTTSHRVYAWWGTSTLPVAWLSG